MCAGLALLMSLGLAGAAAPAAHGQSAGTWNRRGQDAEAKEDYDAAFEAYRQAHQKSPKDLRYKERFERLRFQAAALHVDRGRVLRQSGDSGGAMTEFTRALQIDPGNQAATQELELTQRQTAPGAVPPGSAAGPGAPGSSGAGPTSAQVQKDFDSLSSPVQLQPVSTDPITLNMVEDTKVIYQAVGKAAGLNVIFDPDLKPTRIPVDLHSVSLWDALRIVETLSKTFWKPVTANTIFVGDGDVNKRKNLEDYAIQTFYLTNVSQQSDANEVQIAVRNMLDPSVKMYLVPSQNAMVVRGTPDELALAGKIIHDIDRQRSEVVVDVAVLEVSRDKIRNLGITLPTSFGLTPQQSNANVSTGTSSTNTNNNGTGTGTGTGTSTSTITLNTLGNINATNFAVSVSGGQLNALLSDSDTRVLQNPRIRATDGQKATLKIGSKIPVATGSYSAGAAITTASLGVQTQFQYLDVGVNIEMTPTVHLDRDVSLKMKIEVSSHTGDQTISGVTEPIISQRVIDQVIQLKEGEPSILAGILQKQDTRTVSGTPGLGEIPLLKYFFSSQGKEQQTDEIVFLLIPHIVRSAMMNGEETRPIYVGTGQSVELIRHDAANVGPAVSAPVSGTAVSPSGISAANAATAMVGQLAAQARPPVPSVPGAVINQPSAVQPPAAAPAAAAPSPAALGPVRLSIIPPAMNQAVGATFQVAITAANAHDLFSVPVQLHFDPQVLALQDVTAGDLLGHDGQAIALTHRDDGNGTVTVSASRPPNTQGIEGQGTVFTLTFKALAGGDATLSMVKLGAKDSRQNTLPAVGTQATVHVK